MTANSREVIFELQLRADTYTILASMRIATWNVNSMNARQSYVFDWLDTRQPDIACLQELKIAVDDFPHAQLAERGYHAAVHSQQTWNGVAVLAKPPLDVVQVGLPGRDNDGARLVTARVDESFVTSVYVPNGKTVEHPDFDMKLKWLDALHEYLKDLKAQGSPQIVGGDFNLVPADIDSYHPESAAGTIFHTDAERERFGRILDLGLVDLFRVTAPTEPGFSWWDYRGGNFHKGLGLRIDLLLVSPEIADRVSSVAVDRTFRKKRKEIWDIKPSDHAPVEAILSDKTST